ncbi:MAG: hypothetical protein LHW56_01825 [Candidatus Cloacimonetes bacterium]|nr:hypothetical protein [Candidatus Cloacimonadota bacterium]MDY0171626.1 hypothetical protein [Candidatus Cloacimonadaceae bacterium]
MSFKEFSESAVSSGFSEAPSLGKLMSGAGSGPSSNPLQEALKKKGLTLKVRYLTGAVSDDGFRMLLEDIMTRSLHRGEVLQASGDVAVLREDHTFDKSGEYIVALKYMEVLSLDGHLGELHEELKEQGLPEPAPTDMEEVLKNTFLTPGTPSPIAFDME